MNKDTTKEARALPVIQTNVAGVDLGSRHHRVCGPPRLDGKPNVQVYATTTPKLNDLVDWLVQQDVESVAMESTGVYWIPLYELLESRGIKVVLVNARELRNVPGRKTDMKDCQWIQRLHSCGLLRGSFRPDETICVLRALHRQWDNRYGHRSRDRCWRTRHQ